MTKAEFLKLPMDQRGKILEEQAESVADIYNTPPGLCPDPIPDHIQDELTTLRDRVNMLQRFLDTANAKASHAENALEVGKDRIRELEEALPNPQKMRPTIQLCFHGHADAWEKLDAIADRIEKVMKK